LCEYNCAFANSGARDMATALKGKPIRPRIHIEEAPQIAYAVSCRHCKDPLCVKSCISGALHLEDGAVCIDHARCVGCLTCVLVCPYGAVLPGPDGAAMKCELCLHNAVGAPACAAGCPNRAIVYEERGEAI
jgi:carbon-monoxide dehydrogenase iron sulfur subunit